MSFARRRHEGIVMMDLNIQNYKVRSKSCEWFGLTSFDLMLAPECVMIKGKYPTLMIFENLRKAASSLTWDKEGRYFDNDMLNWSIWLTVISEAKDE